ncbi:hypothetical protein [Salinigranum salinum]|uniref:hypothetical protein n=1 Tax=Salinigranum salinum TaxID=1364937 RepID=UPI0012612F51|nr:hypothetical protein [Salinigranum salinum]
MASRGTDPETEERRLRLREGNDAIGTWLERLFDATAELVVFGIPVLISVVLFNSATLSARTIATATGFIVVAAAVMRGSLPVGSGWPGSSTRLSVARVVYFGTVLVAGIAVPGVVLGVAGAPLSALALALCVGAIGAAAFAPLVGLVGR